MKRFKSYINEQTELYSLIEEEYDSILLEKDYARWTQSAAYHMFNGNVLVTPALTKLIAATPRGTFWHTTSPKFLNRIFALQGKQASISTNPSLDVGRMEGIHELGLVVKVHADAIVGSDRDIMSIPDLNGRRWIPRYEFISMAEDSNIDAFDVTDKFNDWKKKNINKAANMISDPQDKAEVMIILNRLSYRTQEYNPTQYTADKMSNMKLAATADNAGISPERFKKIEGYIKKALQFLVKRYITFSKKVAQKFAASHILKHMKRVYDSPVEGTNEFVVNNIKVKGIACVQIYKDSMWDFAMRMIDTYKVAKSKGLDLHINVGYKIAEDWNLKYNKFYKVEIQDLSPTTLLDLLDNIATGKIKFTPDNSFQKIDLYPDFGV